MSPPLFAGVLVLCSVVASTASNRIVAWGDNTWGETNVPPALSNVVAIAAGRDFSLALKPDGTVVGWGRAPFAIVPPNLTNVVAIAAGDGRSLALKEDGTLVAWGAPSLSTLTNIPADLTNIVAISCGDSHNLVLKSDGRAAAWGANFSGQTNIPTDLSNVVAIYAGNSGSLAIQADGRLWGTGNFTNRANAYSNIVGAAIVANGNSQGGILLADGTAQLWGYPASNGTTNLSGIVALCGRSGFNQAGAMWALGRDGTLIGFGPLYLGQTNVYLNLSNVLAVAVGYDHHLAIVGEDFPVEPPAVSRVDFTEGVFSVEVPGARGVAYFLESSESLLNPNWQMCPPVPGQGSVIRLSDSQADSPLRLYRVRQSR